MSAGFPIGRIRSRMQAERAAEGSAAACGMMAMLFGFGFLGEAIGSPHKFWQNIAPLWAVYLTAALGIAVIAFAVHRLKSIALSGLVLAFSIGMSLYAIWALLHGRGNMIGVPMFMLPWAVWGFWGTRALRSDLPLYHTE